MAMRSALARIPAITRSASKTSRMFSDSKGKVLSEEERAAENVYIQKMERERKEKLKLKAEKEKAELDKSKDSEKEIGLPAKKIKYPLVEQRSSTEPVQSAS